MGRTNTDAALSGGIMESETFKKSIDLSGFAAFVQGNPSTAFQKDFRRYGEHLVFRKFLSGPEPVLYQMAALFILGDLLEYYLYLSAYQSGNGEPTSEDLHTAYKIVERIFSHAINIRPFFQAFAQGFISYFSSC
jgi:hypothetical protein